jgi:biotin carboxyl carrier protein
MKYNILINGAKHPVEFIPPSQETVRITAIIDGRRVEADVVRVSPGVYSVLIGGRSLEVGVEQSPKGLLLWAAGREFAVEIPDPRAWRHRRRGNTELEGRQQILAPMPGKIVRVLAVSGQQVETGQGMLVIEAMKMQNEIRSPKSGTVERMAEEGQTVNAGEILAVVA